MRKVLVLLAVSATAHAEPVGEFGGGLAYRPLSQLHAGGCEYQLELRGAIVDGWLRDRIDSTGPLALGAIDELVLPRGAKLVGARLDANPATAVPTQYTAEPANDAVGADPALVTALLPDENGHPRFRAIIAPFGRSTTLALHFTAIADIHGGALRFTLPASTCTGTVKVTPGPGATLARLRVGNVDTKGPFELNAADAEIVADLAYGRPLLWSQAEPLGDGFVARADTKIAPLAKAPGARRVLLLIDGSRSMELVGQPAVAQVVHAIGAALPAQAEVEAVIFDRTPSRVLGSWKPADATTLAAIDTALHAHVPGNGSDAVAALALAHNLIADTRGEAMVIMITDGALGTLESGALTRALDSRELAVDLHAIVLDRGHLTAQSPEPLRLAIAHYGGSYVEVGADELTGALAEIDTWLRPSATVGGRTLLAGTGAVELTLAHATKGTAAPIAQLVLAQVDPGDDADLEKQLVTLTARHPWANADYAFSVLATKGKVARARRDTVAGGGPFTRMVEAPDPPFPPEVAPPRSPYVAAASIDKQILDTLFRLQLQPAAYVCYQRAIGRATLAGTVAFHLEISRGEVTTASVEGLGDPTFDACILDAAYRLVPPMPDPAYNSDDRSIVNYPLTFQIHEQHPLVIPGDADSSSPLDIDAIKGGPPPRHVTPGDTKNPLGGLRPTVNVPPPPPAKKQN